MEYKIVLQIWDLHVEFLPALGKKPKLIASFFFQIPSL